MPITLRCLVIASTLTSLACSPTARGPAPPPPDNPMPDSGAAPPPPPDAAAAPAGDGAAPPPDAALAPDRSAPSPDATGDRNPPAPAAVCGTGANRLGPPTALELMQVSQRIKASPYMPAGTNQGNNFAYGNAAQLAGQMSSMYALTGDTFFLDEEIKFSDYMLANRNDTATGRVIWTGKREPCWPNKAETAGDAAYCGSENGLVVGHIVGTARTIFRNPALWSKPVGIPDPHGYGPTYLERARTYLREGNRTLEELLVPYYVQPAKGNRLYIPTHPGFAALTGGNYAKDQGHALPWNQQDMVVGALTAVADCLLALNEDPATVARNETLIKAALDWFVSDLQSADGSYQANGVPVYKWGYGPGDFKHIENLAHASADINMLYNGYRRGRSGVERTTLVPIANTFLEVIAKPDGTYASEVDGSGTRASVSGSWMNYEELRAGIVARLSPSLTIDANTPVGSAISILSQRKKLCP